MRIAFATLYDTQDINRGSGSYYFMSRAIENQGHDVVYIGPIEWHPSPATRLFKKISTKLGKRYRSHQDIFAARQIGSITSQKLTLFEHDLLITNDYGIAAFAQTLRPKILYSDAIFPKHYGRNTHPWLSDLFPLNVLFAQHIVNRGLKEATLCCFPSHSAVDVARDYGISETKIRLIPFGANLEDPGRSPADARSFGRVLEKGTLKLLFVGKYWQLKGGDVAVNVLGYLREHGIDAILHIVGTEPPQLRQNGNIIVHGHLDKARTADQQKIKQLYQDCDIFILPSVAEGFGIVFTEAAAYGMPSLGFDTMGVNTAVAHSTSGVLIPLGVTDPARAFADIILSWYDCPDLYNSLVKGSRQHFEERVNWRVAVSGLLTEIEAVIR